VRSAEFEDIGNLDCGDRKDNEYKMTTKKKKLIINGKGKE
jgi:hypothetical protein